MDNAGKEPRAQDCRQTPGSGKGEEMNSPLEPLEGT